MLSQIPSLENLDFIKEIAKDDWMMRRDRDPDWYFNRGYGALVLVAFECQRARLIPTSILDFGCGHGAVARMLKANYPNARIVGQDVNPKWMEWCADVLGIETVISPAKILEVELEENSYDIIWAGSVFSHIPEHAAVHLLKQFRRALTDRGVAIFSTAGQIMRNSYRPEVMHNFSESVVTGVAKAFDRGEYGYSDYDQSQYVDWGHALTPYRWYFDKSIELDFPLCGFYEAGWGMVQDVYAMRKRPNPVSWT